MRHFYSQKRVCLWHSRQIVLQLIDKSKKEEPEIVFSAPHEGALI